jgi:hypothetical protein
MRTICVMMSAALLAVGCKTNQNGDEKNSGDGSESIDTETDEGESCTGAGCNTLTDDACSGTLIECSEGCVDPAIDLKNCGRCDHMCGAGEVCDDGVCATLPKDCVEAGGCALGYYCDPATHLCAPGCVFDDDCPSKATCDEEDHECQCPSGSKACGQVCISRESPLACGKSCEPCPEVAERVTICDQGSCAYTCEEGLHECGRDCVSDDSVEHCGDSCTPCEERSNSVAGCDGTSCRYECNEGYHECDEDYCASDESVDHCGSSCEPCPEVSNGTPTCDGTTCGAVCDEEYHLCDGACLSDDSPNSCGDLCTPCPYETEEHADPICVDGRCDIQCYEGYWRQDESTCRFFEISDVGDEENDGFDGSLALDNNGYPHISCAVSHRPPGEPDDYYFHSLAYRYWDGVSWIVETVEDEEYRYRYTSLALDNDESPHIAYSTEGAVRYARLTSAGWVIDTVDSDGASFMFTSMALDANGLAHISYLEDDNHELRYAHLTDTQWIVEVVDPEGRMNGALSLVLDGDGHPHISYFDKAAQALKYAHSTGDSWLIETVDSGDSTGYGSSLALDADGNVHISYIERGTQCMKYARRTGTAWDIETVATDVETYFYYKTAIAIDKDASPHIAYNDELQLYYAHLIGAYWSIDTVMNGSQAPAIVLDDDEYPHFVYTYAIKWDKNALRYATPKIF